jgi:site-specific DNA recombinase
MRAVLYARVSTELQKEAGSIESQVSFAREHCRLQKIEILNVYRDEGVSGSVRVNERPEGARLLREARAGKFDCVLVFRIDRLARRTSDLLNTVEELEACGVSLRSLTEPFDTSTPAGKFMISTLGGIAELERANFRDRTKAGMERLAREGRWLGGKPPFGYRVVDGKLAIDPEQSDIVKKVFVWYLSGQRVRGIAQRLNALAVRHPLEWNKRGKDRPWYESTVSKLLKNRVYIGESVWRKRTDRKKVAGRTVVTKTTPEQQIKVGIPSLVSLDDFNRVQEILKENFRVSLRNAKYPYLLRALVTCGECGRRYVGLGSGRPRWYHHYYRCSSHVSAVGRVPCAGKAMRADLLDQAVWEQCLAFIENPGSILQELRDAMAAQQYSQSDAKNEIGQMESALRVKARERGRVISLIRRSVISEAEGERELVLLHSEVLHLERQRDELQSRLAAAENSELRVLTVEAMLGLLRERAAVADENTKREIIGAFVDGIVVHMESGRPTARVCYVFRSAAATDAGVDSVEVGVATSNARFAACCPRTSRKSTL